MRRFLFFGLLVLCGCATTTSSPAEKLDVGMSVEAAEVVLGSPMQVDGDCRVYSYTQRTFSVSPLPYSSNASRGVLVMYEGGLVKSFRDVSYISGGGAC